jgi:hypothetical protein
MVVVKARLHHVLTDICKSDQINVWANCCGAEPNFLLATTPGVSSG